MLATDPLPSWAHGPVKTSITDFVTRVTEEGSSDFVPIARRIATFDNDGTLWCEQPMLVQVYFLIDSAGALAARDPAIAERQPYKALLERDYATLISMGKAALLEMICSIHAGLTNEELEQLATGWFATSRSPLFKRLFTDLVYQPQLELLTFLRDNGFKTFIVSGGGIDFIRAFAEKAYGIPPEQVIGSSAHERLEIGSDGMVSLVKLPQLHSFDDREEKVVNIARHIGRRPIFGFGNSDGDLAMLRYIRTGPGATLALLLHHDDAEREAKYDREFKLSPLSEGLAKADDYGVTLVSMKKDWLAVFPPAPS